MTNKRKTIRFLNKDDLRDILHDLALELVNQRDHLTLAIPPNEVLTYYEAQLLTRVETSPEGLWLHVAIPLAGATTEMTVYKATPIPRPDPKNPGKAIIWDIETEYIAQSGDNQVLLTKDQLETCIGSTATAICTNGFSIINTRRHV